jgi:lipoprotein-anchoring transpeptidase ErfK/SrfK
MVQFPYKAASANAGKKRTVIVYSLCALLLLVVCVTVYSCTKKGGTEQTAASTTPSQPSPSAPAAPVTSLAPATSPQAPVVGSTATVAATPAAAMPVVATPANDVKTSAEATALIAEANASIAQNKIIKARDTLKLVLSMPLSAADAATVKGTMSRLSDSWLFGPTVLTEDTLCSNYTVKSGDKFINIARNHKTDYEVLLKINNIAKPSLLRAGQNIKVINGPFRAVVSRSTYTLDLYLQNTYVRSFRVGLGQPGRETPTGLWEVTSDKSIKPKWTDPDTKKTYYGTDPDYPLGTRWIGLKGIDGLAKGRTGFALHGTNKPEELGTNISRGCIRLANPDVELLYSLMAPVSTQVSVVD